VHITKSDNIFTVDFVEVTSPSTAYADTGYIEFLTWWNMTGSSENIARNNRERRRCRRTTHKITPG
ncbi:unnamed protein product, partial [marine sediment metagenome]